MASFRSTTRENPRMIWDRMTPEFPRAPRSAPCDSALSIICAECSGDACTSLSAACIVNSMLVPGIAIGHRKDIQAVDIRNVTLQPRGTSRKELAQFLSAQQSQRRP